RRVILDSGVPESRPGAPRRPPPARITASIGAAEASMPGPAIDAPPGFASRKKAVPDRIPRGDSGRETGRSEPRGPAGGGTKVTGLARSVPGLRGIGAGISAVFLRASVRPTSAPPVRAP